MALQEEEIGDELDAPTGVAEPSLRNAQMALAASPQEEIGEGDEVSEQDALEGAMSQKDPMDNLLANLGSKDMTTVMDNGAMAGGHIGNKELGPVGALMGASMGSVMSRSLAHEQSGESELTSRYAEIIRGFTDKSGVPALTFQDGTVLQMPIDPTEEVPTSQIKVLDGKSTKKSVEIDETYPTALNTAKKVAPIAKHIVENVYGFKSKDSTNNKKLVEYIKGSLTNTLISDGPPKDVIDIRIKELTLKLGLS